MQCDKYGDKELTELSVSKKVFDTLKLTCRCESLDLAHVSKEIFLCWRNIRGVDHGSDRDLRPLVDLYLPILEELLAEKGDTK